MNGINLLASVRDVISGIHPDMKGIVYRSIGQKFNNDGSVSANYQPEIAVRFQSQSISGGDKLSHVDMISSSEIARNFYIFSDNNNATRISGIIRNISKTGDLIRISPNENWFPSSIWLVRDVVEDFSNSGWVKVLAVMQRDKSASGSILDSDFFLDLSRII